MEVGVPEYWIVDEEAGEVTVVRADQPDVVVRDRLTWHPPGASAPLVLEVQSLLTDT